MKQANSVDAFLRILDQYKSDSEQYIGHKRIWEQFLQIFTHLTNTLSDGLWDEFVQEVCKEKKRIRNLYVQLQDFGHSHDKEFDDFLGTISVVVGIVDDFHLLIENKSNKGTQYMIDKRIDEVSVRIKQTNQGFSKWATKMDEAK